MSDKEKAERQDELLEEEIDGWVNQERLREYQHNQQESRTVFLEISSYPILKEDVPVKLVKIKLVRGQNEEEQKA